MNNRRFDGGALLRLCYSTASSHPSKPLGQPDPCQPLRLLSRDSFCSQPPACCQPVISQSICPPKLGDPSYTGARERTKTDSLTSKPTSCCTASFHTCAHATSACKHRIHHRADGPFKLSRTISRSICGHVCYQPFGSWRNRSCFTDFSSSSQLAFASAIVVVIIGISPMLSLCAVSGRFPLLCLIG